LSIFLLVAAKFVTSPEAALRRTPPVYNPDSAAARAFKETWRVYCDVRRAELEAETALLVPDPFGVSQVDFTNQSTRRLKVHAYARFPRFKARLWRFWRRLLLRW
jgi:hypothetical protein